MKVAYDTVRERIIATGLDQQVKFFELTEDNVLKLAYKIKLGGPVFQF